MYKLLAVSANRNATAGYLKCHNATVLHLNAMQTRSAREYQARCFGSLKVVYIHTLRAEKGSVFEIVHTENLRLSLLRRSARQ